MFFTEKIIDEIKNYKKIMIRNVRRIVVFLLNIIINIK